MSILISWLLLALISDAVLADGMILPEMTSPDYLSVRYHHVTVDIEDHGQTQGYAHAVTKVEQAFYNPHPFTVSGRYIFPVPPDAILSDFQALVEGEHQTIIHQDAATTNATLYDNVVQQRDPSLFQYADWESLAFDLSIPAGETRRMTLEYEEVLPPSGGMLHYRYILSTERYSAQPLEEASIRVDIRTASGLSTLYSPSHNITTEHRGAGQTRIQWQAENVRPDEDFDLFFASAEDGFGSGLLTGLREGHRPDTSDGHILFLFAPETMQDHTQTLPKDIVFVIDRSGSMSGDKIEQARNALTFILGQLNADDRFSIVGFDHRLLILAQTLQNVQSQTLSDARHFVDTLQAEGDTDLEAALQTGLEILRRSETRPEASQLIVFLTDGLPTAGVTDEARIASRVTRTNERVGARLHVFGVGYDVNTHLLDRLAADNGGTVTYVQPPVQTDLPSVDRPAVNQPRPLEHALSDFYKRIAHPVLTDIEIDLEGIAVTDTYPQQLPDMFQGSSLLLTGRYDVARASSQVIARVRGRAGTQAREYIYHFDLAQTGEHDFVPRLWATRRIGHLLDRVRVDGETPALVEEIRELGLGYGIVTPYTTFVITAQADGAASARNMQLYENQSALNQVSGETTIQARVQNQSYQQAAQANLAQGANVVNQGQHSLAHVSNQNIDLALLQEQKNLEGPITDDWIAENIAIDQQVTFGSDAYFVLAQDPDARAFLQSGPNVIFEYQDQVIAVQDPETPKEGPDSPITPDFHMGPQQMPLALWQKSEATHPFILQALSHMSGVSRILLDFFTWGRLALRVLH
jgi:Ca-activated chloride channel family protein